MDKTELRRAMLAHRSSLTAEERARLALAAQAALIGSEPFQRAGLILLYQAFRGEVSTEQIAAAAVAAGKGLALPRVQREPRKLFLHAYAGDPTTLAAGAYGIAEPRPEWPEVEYRAVDLVVVPGVAFDRQGGRLGYGGGYYDRLLPGIRAANPGAVLLGLAFDLQVIDRLPSDAHDIPVDAIATERGFQMTRGDV
jgi:5-formyltetrahydrofolate cyclo-ligase